MSAASDAEVEDAIVATKHLLSAAQVFKRDFTALHTAKVRDMERVVTEERYMRERFAQIDAEIARYEEVAAGLYEQGAAYFRAFEKRAKAAGITPADKELEKALRKTHALENKALKLRRLITELEAQMAVQQRMQTMAS